MQNNYARPPSGRARRILRQAGKAPLNWQKLAYARAYTIRYGMRAAKLSAVIDCIKAVRKDGVMPLP